MQTFLFENPWVGAQRSCWDSQRGAGGRQGRACNPCWPRPCSSRYRVFLVARCNPCCVHHPMPVPRSAGNAAFQERLSPSPEEDASMLGLSLHVLFPFSQTGSICVYLTLISPARSTLELILPLSLACQGKPFQDFLTHILETFFIFFFLAVWSKIEIFLLFSLHIWTCLLHMPDTTNSPISPLRQAASGLFPSMSLPWQMLTWILCYITGKKEVAGSQSHCIAFFFFF